MSTGKSLAWTAPTVAAAAAIGSVATKETKSRWYRSLDKPPFQPPAPVFPIAWTGFYASIAGSAAVVDAELAEDHTEEARGRRRRFRVAMLINLILNAGWCWTFFRWRKLPESTAVAGALALSTADLARRAAAAKPGAGAALLPYVAWTTFATVLTGSIWRRNPRK